MRLLNRNPYWRSWPWFLVLGALLACGHVTTAQTPSAVVRRYVEAIQRRDFKTVIDLTYSYQREVARIKAQNPQVLWPRLIDQYYTEKIRSLSQDPGFMGNFAENIIGDMAQAIRPLQGLLPPSGRWAITESRPSTNSAAVTIYVTIDYPNLEKSPEIENKFLKQLIVQFLVDRKSNLLLGVSSVPASNVYWTKPYPATARPFLAKKFGGAFTAATQEVSARWALSELTDLGWGLAEPELLGALKNRATFYNLAIPVLVEGRSTKALPPLVEMLQEQVASGRNSLCEEPVRAVAAGVGSLGKSAEVDTVTLLRESLSSVINTGLQLTGGNTAGMDDRECADTYLTALAAVDDASWRSFPYWYPEYIEAPGGRYYGGAAFWKLLADFANRQDSRATIDLASPNAARIAQFLSSIELCVPKPAWECPTRFYLERVSIDGPSTAKLFGYFDHWNGQIGLGGGYDRIGNFEMKLRAASNSPSGWLVKDLAVK